MTLNLGVIGCGAIARTHIDRITNTIAGGRIAGVFDVVPEQSKAVVAEYGLDATIFDSDSALIESSDIDAVIVTSRNDAHVSPILQSIAAGKCVFTEKPLATTAEDCKRIVEAEVTAGRRFVQVGFMRRYDPGYRQLKEVIASGEIGPLLLASCRHYNAAPATPYFGTENVINDTFIHEIDIMRFLFDDTYTSIEMRVGRRNSLNPIDGLQEPQVGILETSGGALITAELNINCQYGYDIACRVVGETGTAELPRVPVPEIRKGNKIYEPITSDGSLRFLESYNLEFQAFINSVTRSQSPGQPSAWDGYVAAVTADAAIRSLSTGERVAIELDATPALYSA